MYTPRDFYREQHPGQFSDSKIISKAKLDINYFEYFLSTLTSRSQEKDFERFCKAIAEKEICPNLIVQTGPTGGGDSKVDTETYPVSDDIALAWYSGVGREASNERWAFAISAKQDWKPKVKSDVESILSTNRDYKLIYFMSNQFISDKKRAETEDDLKSEHGIDVRILDKSWLTEKLFAHGYQNIAVEQLHISDNFLDEVDTGPLDFKRKKELDALEKQLPDLIANGDYSKSIESAMQTYILSRELELPETETVGRLYRASELAKKYGTPMQVKECLCDWAWTLYWWYNSYDAFYERYCNYEDYISDHVPTIHDIELLSNLWMNLFSISHRNKGKYDFDKHTTKLNEFFNKAIKDDMKPNQAFAAKAKYISVRLMLGESIDKLVDELIAILQQCDYAYEFDFLTIQRMVMQIPVYQEATRYDELFEILISISEKRKQELEAARLLRIRAQQLTESRPYDAIRFYGRALVKLIKCESKQDLVDVLFSMGVLFNKVGLVWASRGYYLNAFQIAMNHYFDCGETYSSLIGALNGLKNIEMLLGRIVYSVEFHKLEQISISLYLSENPDSTLKNVVKEETVYLFDSILGIQIFRTRFAELDGLEYTPDYINGNGLQFASIAMKYVLGYEDEEFKQGFESKEAEKDFVKHWYNQPARGQLIGLPWYGFGDIYTLKSNIIGCTINISAENKFPCIELGESLLGSTESFLATGFVDGVYSMTPEINIGIKHKKSDNLELSYEHVKDKAKPTYIIYCSSYPEIASLEVQHEVKEFLLDITVQLVAHMIHFESTKNALENMVKEDTVFDRAINFTGSIQIIKNYFNSTPTAKSVTTEYKYYPIKRIAPLEIPDELFPMPENKHDAPTIKKIPNIQQVKQNQIITTSTINIPLWDIAKWRAVAFLSDYSSHLALTPAFENIEAGKRIFEQWIETVGHEDKEDYIKIGIIKGINKEHPFYYRVVFSPNIDAFIDKNQSVLVFQQCRFHTMEATTDQNLKIFEDGLKKIKHFRIFPSGIQNGKFTPIDSFFIEKDNVEIKEAWLIDEESFMANAILPNDNPIIPPFVSDAPILKVIERHKMFKDLNERY